MDISAYLGATLKRRFLFILLSGFLVLFVGSCSRHPSDFSQKSGPFRQSVLLLLTELSEGLMANQVNDSSDPNYGAISDDRCHVFHTRAGEAVYPFAVLWKSTQDDRYLDSAIRLGNWLVSQQKPGGYWEETPEKWTGTTVDQLLMLALALPILEAELSDGEVRAWKQAIILSADFLTDYMSLRFTNSNYLATTAAALVISHPISQKKSHLRTAKSLARMVVKQINRDGFIVGEGAFVGNRRFGIDIGYNLGMTIWGLGLYAKEVGDRKVWELLDRSLQTHLHFVWPDGSIDNSWGIRSNKWTTYGGVTADGALFSFALFANEDPRFGLAADKILKNWKKNMVGNVMSYGPMQKDVFGTADICVYPSFAKAKNLALTLEFGAEPYDGAGILPSEDEGTYKYFKTLNTLVVRTKTYLATVTAYQYWDFLRGHKSKYNYRPSGGAITNLWFSDVGFIQIGSQSEYHRWELMHFPATEVSILPLTPRVEFREGKKWFTNLFEFRGKMKVKKSKDGFVEATTIGSLKDSDGHDSLVNYSLTHFFKDARIEHSLSITNGRDNPIDVSVIEPVIDYPDSRYEKVGEKGVVFENPFGAWELGVLDGEVQVEMGLERERYVSIFPPLRGFPISFHMTLDPGETKLLTYFFEKTSK